MWYLFPQKFIYQFHKGLKMLIWFSDYSSRKTRHCDYSLRKTRHCDNSSQNIICHTYALVTLYYLSHICIGHIVLFVTYALATLCLLRCLKSPSQLWSLITFDRTPIDQTPVDRTPVDWIANWPNRRLTERRLTERRLNKRRLTERRLTE
jgi:hypothetical protein